MAIKSLNILRRAIKGRPVTIVGAGTQGRRLAYMWSSLGGPVHIIDRDASSLKEARLDIKRRLESTGKSVNHGRGEISTFVADDKKQALEKSWLIVECVPESLALKRQVVSGLDEFADPDAIIASNSSSYTISEIMDGQVFKNPKQMISLHSYWPPETAAIEVMASAHTNPEIVPLLMDQCKAHGFSPFHVKKNSNGYIYNRIWAAIKREALFVAAENVASPQEIDEIFKDVLKTPKGPFEQMDVVGLDVVCDIEDHYAETRTGLPQEPRDLLRAMIKDGKLGIKSGRGFYKY